jgi:hypothetical protein
VKVIARPRIRARRSPGARRSLEGPTDMRIGKIAHNAEAAHREEIL